MASPIRRVQSWLVRKTCRRGIGVWVMPRRQMSVAQAATALRPFYFMVHPDLFAKYPHIQLVNEQSLKLLHEHLNRFNYPSAYGKDSLVLTFFLRDKQTQLVQPPAQSGGEFRMIKLNLAGEQTVSRTVQSILEGCSLPTEHITRLEETTTVHAPGQLPPDWTEYDEQQLKVFWKRKAVAKSRGLQEWLVKLRPEADKLFETHRAVGMDVEARKAELRERTGIRDVLWDNEWSLYHCRGCLLALNKAFDVYGDAIGMELRDKEIRFGNSGTFLAVDGRLNLGVEDVAEEWMRLIRVASSTIGGVQGIFSEMESLQATLSGRLGGVQVRCVSASNTSVLRYMSWLRLLNRNLRKADFQLHLLTGPDVLVMVHSEAGSCFLGVDGQMHVPANCSPDRLQDFLKESIPLAKHRLVQNQKARQLLEITIQNCLGGLRLRSLDFDRGRLTLDEVQESLDRLEELGADGAISNLLQDVALLVGRGPAYSALSDGRISIPVDWAV